MPKKQQRITTRYSDQWNTHWLTDKELKRWLHDHWQEVQGFRRVWLNPFYSRDWDSFWKLLHVFSLLIGFNRKRVKKR